MALQFSIALCTAMVAATLVPNARRAIPRPVEIVMWAILVLVCVVGVISITNTKAHELTASASWGIGQVINTFAGLLLAGALGWVSDQRFVIATSVVLMFAVDILALALVSSHRQAQAWQPRLRLGDWMELPRLSAPMAPVMVANPLDGANRRLAAATAVAAASLLTSTLTLMIWMRDLLIPRASRRLAPAMAAGRVESRARLESIGHAGARLELAGNAWHAASGAPIARMPAAGATETWGAADELEAGRLADIKVLSGGQSSGWYGPLRPGAVATDEEDRDGKHHTDRLAS